MVPSVAKAIRVLDAVGNATRPPSLGELARKLEIPKSTLHDICETLVRERLLTRAHDGRFRLGVRILDFYRAYDAATQFTSEFAKVCEEFAPLHEETLVLSVLDGRDVVYVACRSGTQPIAVNYRIGLRLPSNCTATGKAILSTLTDDEVRALFSGVELVASTPRSIRTVEGLLRELHQTRERGYSVDDEETVQGMCCVGAPIPVRGDRRAAGAIAFSIVKARVTSDRFTSLARDVVELGRVLSQRLG